MSHVPPWRRPNTEFVGLLSGDANPGQIQAFLDRIEEMRTDRRPRIDAHQHFWRFSPKTHAWIDDSMAALKRDFLPDDLAPLLDAAEFDGSIAVQAQTSIAETEWLLALAAEHDFIRGVVGWVDLGSPHAHDDLARLSKHPKLVGVRHVVQAEPAGFMARQDFRRGVACLEDFALTYDILIYERQLAEALDLVRAFPEQKFVIDHIAKPDVRNGSFDTWRAGIEVVAGEPNVWCKLSGMVTEADWSAWSPSDFTPYVDAVVAAFGPDRCMIGSDWPVCTLACDYAAVMGIVVNYSASLSPSDQDAVLGGTAATFYGV